MTELEFHNATYKRVVRIVGQRHFGYEVRCSCGYKCDKHYKATGAIACVARHEKDFVLGVKQPERVPE